MRVAVALIALCACGRIGFDRTGVDAIDARIGTGPFNPPQPFDDINSPASDRDPTVRGDLCELLFSSSRPGGMGAQDLWVTRRATRDDPWQQPVVIGVLNSTVDDTSPKLSRDGLELYFTSSRAGTEDVFVTTRTDVDAAWQPPTLVAELSSPSFDVAGLATADRTLMYIASTRASSQLDIFVSTRAPPEPWGTPVLVPELATGGGDGGPNISPDGLVLAFDSARTGDFEIYITERGSRAEPFASPVWHQELGSSALDEDPWLSPDRTVIVFSSNRGANADIYWAER